MDVGGTFGGPPPGAGGGLGGSAAGEVPPWSRVPAPPSFAPHPFPEAGDPCPSQWLTPLPPFERPAAETKLGPTGRPMPTSRAAPADRARRHGSSPCAAGRAGSAGRRPPSTWAPPSRSTAAGPARRLRPAGVALGRARAQPHEMDHHLQPADAARRLARRRRRAQRRAGDGPAAVNIDLSAAGSSSCTRSPASRPPAGARPGDRAVRRHPHRLPALARPADRQRAHRQRRRDRARWSAVLRAARRGPAQDDDRQGA